MTSTETTSIEDDFPGVVIEPGIPPVDDKAAEKALKAVKKATSVKKFNAAEFIKNGGVTIPRTTIPIFLDAEACFEIEELNKQITAHVAAHTMTGDAQTIAGAYDEDEDDWVQEKKAEREKWAERNAASVMTFHLRAVPTPVDNAIRRKLFSSRMGKKGSSAQMTPEEQAEWVRRYNAQLLCFAVEKIEMDDQVDDHQFTEDEMADMVDSLYESEQNKLINTMTYLSRSVTLADLRTDAGFPG